jgi:predicted dehydrogenase
MSDVRWGILGAAKFAREFMGPALTLAPGGHVAELTPELAKAEPFAVAPGLVCMAATKHGWPIRNRRGLHPATNRLHVEWSLKAMQAGKHVLCRSPWPCTSTS